MMQVKVIKIGGNVIDDPQALATFTAEMAALEGPKILVHGGGKEASRLCRSLGIEPVMIEGRRVTDAETLQVVTMTYAGLINKRIVAQLQAQGCDAMGLCGADASVIKATRRPAKPIDYGYVGDIDPADIRADLIAKLLQDGITPVFCAITHDGHGTLLNCNADSVAQSVAVAMTRAQDVERVSLTYCFEKDGLLADIDRPDSLIDHIDPAAFEHLRANGTITAGMIPKVTNALAAIAAGVSEVTIKNSVNLLKPRGTTITA